MLWSRNAICPNYVVDEAYVKEQEENLNVDKKELFAHALRRLGYHNDTAHVRRESAALHSRSRLCGLMDSLFVYISVVFHGAYDRTYNCIANGGLRLTGNFNESNRRQASDEYMDMVSWGLLRSFMLSEKHILSL